MSDARLQLSRSYQGRGDVDASPVVVGAELQPDAAPVTRTAFTVRDALGVIASVVTIWGFLSSSRR